ncbi:DNA primase [bacterium]|nr:DNA primase [bacterium]
MSLPPGFLDELRTRLTLSQVVGRKVTWDARKSNMAKGDFWAPCPFHQEKSPSFHVDDRKGFYYCFGCHAKGDALTFVKETENLSFIEAVELLAREAGMVMPERDPQAAERADKRTQLVDVMEEAVKWFRLQLKTSAAAEARAYLARRGLTPEAQDRWHIGFAPDQRQGLFAALTQKGIAPGLIIDAGLCIKPDPAEGGREGPPYDRFRGRIIFPIRDGRGRAISLGGRAMDPAARAKYLNGPETALFDKGRNLFNLGPAREAAGKGLPLIVAEGYMDVIALSEAGFRAAVAPLGTAITEDQLRLMWRVADEPIIALDGDSAGIRAALRLVDLALPLLEAGKGLRFAILPGGQDPDELIKAQGAPAMQKVLDGAQPMVNLLWQRETEGRVFDSPERKAALDKTLRGLINRVADPSIRSHYTEEIRRLRAGLFGPAVKPFRKWTPGAAKGQRPETNPQPLSSTRASALVRGDEAMEEELREAVILAIFTVHPGLIHRFESDLERLDLTSEDHRSLRHILLTTPVPQMADRLQGLPALDALLARPHVQIAPPVRNRQDAELAMLCLAEEFAKLDARRGARREVADAMEDLTGVADEGLTWRLAQAASARHRADQPNRTDTADLGEDRNALSNHLQSLIDSKVWEKKRP